MCIRDRLGINHPEDVGNWYHEEYMEPQKIAEHVVHVDASANGYFMMYLTENGELYGAGANLQGILGKDVYKRQQQSCCFSDRRTWKGRPGRRWNHCLRHGK